MKRLSAGGGANERADDTLAARRHRMSGTLVLQDDLGHIVCSVTNDRQSERCFRAVFILQQFALTKDNGEAVEEFVQ